MQSTTYEIAPGEAVTALAHPMPGWLITDHLVNVEVTIGEIGEERRARFYVYDAATARRIAAAFTEAARTLEETDALEEWAAP